MIFKNILLATLLLFSFPAYAANIAFVQSAESNTTGTSITLTPPGATTAGDFLILGLSTNGTGGGAAPTGWTALLSNLVPSSSSPGLSVYYRANAPSISSITIGSLVNTSLSAAVFAEYSGVALTSPIDSSATNTGTTTLSPITTNSVTSATPNEMFIGILTSQVQLHNIVPPTISFSAPTNSFTLENQASQQGGGSGTITRQTVGIAISDHLETAAGANSTALTVTTGGTTTLFGDGTLLLAVLP
jgi:hypothetical protein